MKKFLTVFVFAISLTFLTACGRYVETISSEMEGNNDNKGTKQDTILGQLSEKIDSSHHIPAVILPSPDKYTWYIKDYVGMNCASIGYTSIGGDRLDSYGASRLEITFITEKGDYIDIADEEMLKRYVVVSQSLDPNTELKLSFLTDGEGKEYSNLIKSQSYEEIILGVKNISEARDVSFSFSPISPSADKYTYHIKDYVGRNVYAVGYTSIGGDRRDRYGNATLKLVFISDDGIYIDIEDEELLQGYTVVSQNIVPDTELNVTYLLNNNGEEYDNLIATQSYEEIVLGIKKVGDISNNSLVLTPINPSPNKYKYYIRDYVGRNALSVGYTSIGGDRRDSYGSATIKIVFISDDGSYIDVEDDEELKEYIVVAQNLESNTELNLTYLKDGNGKEYENLIENQNIEAINLYVSRKNNQL